MSGPNPPVRYTTAPSNPCGSAERGRSPNKSHRADLSCERVGGLERLNKGGGNASGRAAHAGEQPGARASGAERVMIR
ncbi:hypothetical protein [Azospirillum doebereinerae]